VTLPLARVRVLDLTRILAGPLCTMILADLGADVIKIERPGTGDETRGWGPPFAGDDATYFLSVNRNKRSVTADLQTTEGRRIVSEIAARSDIVIENFRVGLMEEWGLGYADLSARNPRLVYCRLAAFSNPERESTPGYDLVIQAMSGLMSITGQAGGEPTKVGVAIADVLTGLYAAIGLQAALRARDVEGHGQKIVVSLFDSAVASLANQWSNYLIGGLVPKPLGNRHPNLTPYEPFEGSDGRFVLASATDRDFVRTCAVIGRPELATDPRFASNSGRLGHRVELHAELAAAFRTRTAAEWLEKLEAASVPCGSIRSLDAVFASAEGQATIETVEDPSRGSLRLVAGPLRLRGMDRIVRRTIPRAGEHTAEVLAELGITSD
jgi:crotonobetainyl-CoA:carnitine CoA-transferase CaiB-like acyl-CoA transferase